MLENNAVVSANLALYPILNYHKIIKVEFIDVNYYINFEEKYLKKNAIIKIKTCITWCALEKLQLLNGEVFNFSRHFTILTKGFLYKITLQPSHTVLNLVHRYSATCTWWRRAKNQLNPLKRKKGGHITKWKMTASFECNNVDEYIYILEALFCKLKKWLAVLRYWI